MSDINAVRLHCSIVTVDKMIDNESLSGVPLLVLSNKQDVSVSVLLLFCFFTYKSFTYFPVLVVCLLLIIDRLITKG
jgi:hypothetical protein